MILASGTLYLAGAFPLSLSTAVGVGAVPFLGVELVKAVMAAVVARRS